MKRLLIGILLIGIIALILPTFTVAQIAPVGSKALLVGPILTDGIVSGRLGLAKKTPLPGNTWFGGFGEFGQSVEVSGELISLFQVTSKGFLGPVAAAGVDWSGEPGTGTVSAENYFFGAAGLAGTYEIKEKKGIWGYVKWQTAPNDGNLYQSGVTGGVGLYYRL